MLNPLRQLQSSKRGRLQILMGQVIGIAKEVAKGIEAITVAEEEENKNVMSPIEGIAVKVAPSVETTTEDMKDKKGRRLHFHAVDF